MVLPSTLPSLLPPRRMLTRLLEPLRNRFRTRTSLHKISTRRLKLRRPRLPLLLRKEPIKPMSSRTSRR
jgi:hypothetical protein